MNRERHFQAIKEIKRLNKEIKDRNVERDIFRAHVRPFCKHDDDYSYYIAGSANANGEVQHCFVCKICGERRLVIAPAGSFPKENQVSLEELNTIIRDLGLK